MRRLLVLEINEVDAGMLARIARRERLAAWLEVLAWPRARLWSEDQVEHQGLDPWVQWVGVHTGQPRRVHGVLRLGDGLRTDCAQVWEVLGRAGLRSGIWGPMNGARRDAPGVAFFMPDPWTVGEVAWPPELNELLALPRGFATSYTAVEPTAMVRAGLSALRHHLRPGVLRASLGAAPDVARTLLRHGLSNHALFVLHDMVVGRQFLRWRRASRPNLSLLFLNGLAHLMHHAWTEESERRGALRDAVVAYEGLLRELLADRLPGEHVLVANGISQRNIMGEAPRVLHRPRDPLTFPACFGLSPRRVEPLMTNEAHLTFGDRAERDRAVEVLRGLRVGSEALVDVHADLEDERRLFYQLVVWTPARPGAQIEGGPAPVPFQREVVAIGRRTGSHVSEGWAASTAILPVEIPNHELGDWILRYFGVDPASAVS